MTKKHLSKKVNRKTKKNVKKQLGGKSNKQNKWPLYLPPGTPTRNPYKTGLTNEEEEMMINVSGSMFKPRQNSNTKNKKPTNANESAFGFGNEKSSGFGFN